MKNILVAFECTVGEYQHLDYKLFDKKKVNGDIAKIFGVSIKDSNCLSDNTFWDNYMENSISVYSETELNNEQTKTLKELGVIY